MHVREWIAPRRAAAHLLLTLVAQVHAARALALTRPARKVEASSALWLLVER